MLNSSIPERPPRADEGVDPRLEHQHWNMHLPQSNDITERGGYRRTARGPFLVGNFRNDEQQAIL